MDDKLPLFTRNCSMTGIYQRISPEHNGRLKGVPVTKVQHSLPKLAARMWTPSLPTANSYTFLDIIEAIGVKMQKPGDSIAGVGESAVKNNR